MSKATAILISICLGVLIISSAMNKYKISKIEKDITQIKYVTGNLFCEVYPHVCIGRQQTRN